MNTIKQLQQKQKELDDYIIKTKNITISDDHMLSNTFLAAIDELSNEVKEDISNVEEWIDVLHFILSLGNKFGFDLLPFGVYDRGLVKLQMQAEEHLLSAMRLSKCFKHWSNKKPEVYDMVQVERKLEIVIGCIKTACERLGCNMFDEYDKKYKINIQRQKDNY